MEDIPQSPFLEKWHYTMAVLAIIMFAAGIIVYLVYKLRVSLIRDYKEKHDFINANEIKRYKLVLYIFGLGVAMVINLYGAGRILEFGVWFYVRLFMSFAGATLVGYVGALILEYYYPTKLSRKLNKWRYTPRINPKTHNKMRLLSESEEDVHLDEGMQAEENVFSIDYDVWIDEKTGEVKIEKYDGHLIALRCGNCGDPVKNEKGWEVTTIRNVVREVKYGTSAKAGDTGSFPYLRMNNITYEGYMDYSDLKYIDVRDEEKPKFSVKRGDILFNRTNSKDLVGKTGLITTDSEMIIAGYLIRVRVNTDMNPYFVWGHLNSNWAKLILKNMCKNIIGMANINAQELQEIKILKPPRDIQDLFAKCIDKLFDQKTILSKNLEKTNQLFQSLLQKAFNGDLVS